MMSFRSDRRRVESRRRGLACVACVGVTLLLIGPVTAAPRKQPRTSQQPPAVRAAQAYVAAVAGGDRMAAGRLDFACQYLMVTAAGKPRQGFPPATDPIYPACWQRLVEAHQPAIESREQGMDVIWPGKDSLIFFREDLDHYAPSAFVMDRLGTSPPGSGLRADVVTTTALPAVSFRLQEDGPVVAASATLVQLRIVYRDPLTSPITFAPGSYKWTNTVKRPKRAVKAATVGFVTVTGLSKLGFPGDAAVVNVPLAGPDAPGGPVPFMTERGGYVADSAAWWEPSDTPGALIAAVGRAAQFPELNNRVALLNRILIIDPFQADALTLLTRDLYATLLAEAAALHQVPLNDQALAMRVNQLYWDTYAQTTRTEISLGMEMGGFERPTAADYLFRMIPAMEKLARVRPEDLENRIRLGIAYRWNNDQLAAIETHEAVVKDIPAMKVNARARALVELAWSRVAKVAWNRILDDPGVVQAYDEAKEAASVTDRPMERFAAAYIMAYSMIFAPQRDNRLILDRLTEARDWYLQLPGASLDSWRFLLSNDNLKGVVEADPAFQPLIAGSPGLGG